MTPLATGPRRLRPRRRLVQGDAREARKNPTMADFDARYLNVETLCEDDAARGMKVLVRVDFNVPLSKGSGEAPARSIDDDTRVRAALPTIQYLLERDARVILMSHLGRPKGTRSEDLSLDVVAEHLSSLLPGREVVFATDCVGEEVRAAAEALAPGSVFLLENLRFHAAEEKNDGAFAAELAGLADLYVNDAFGTAHRAHASTVGVPQVLGEGKCACGFLMKKELLFLQGAVEAPARPMVAIVGGAKVSSKLPVLRKLLEKCDKVILGGGMVFTFYKAQGLSVGASLAEDDLVDTARELLQSAEERGVELLLPKSVVVADAFDNEAQRQEVAAEAIPEGWMGLDVGPDGVAQVEAALSDANTIVWNGPMGVFEMPNFAHGTLSVARCLAARTAAGATTIVGGGDSVSAVEQAQLSAEMTHVSTGGGASLELLEGKVLPGVAALEVSSS